MLKFHISAILLKIQQVSMLKISRQKDIYFDYCIGVLISF